MLPTSHLYQGNQETTISKGQGVWLHSPNLFLLELGSPVESRHQALLSRHGGAEGEACLSSKWPHDVAWWCASPSFLRGKKKLGVVEAWSMTWKLKHPYIQMVVSIGGFRILTLKWMLQVPGFFCIESTSLVMKKPWPLKGMVSENVTCLRGESWDEVRSPLKINLEYIVVWKFGRFFVKSFLSRLWLW